jgi:hypothetical protein
MRTARPAARTAGSSATSAPSSASVGGSWPAARMCSSSASAAAESSGAGAGAGGGGGDAAGSPWPATPATGGAARRDAGAPGVGAPRAAARIAAEGSITLARLREELGTSRQFAQALLEHLDAERVTRRGLGDARVLRRRPRPAPAGE